jgi:Flp pilus assembly protein CpaB
MLQLKSFPLNAVITGAFTTTEDAVGTVARFPIEENQQVIRSYVVNTDSPAGEALHLVVPAGRRAISITANQVISAGGLTLPGDYVDIIWNCCSDAPIISKTILRNVQVLAVAQGIVKSGPTGETDEAPAAAADDPAPGEKSKPAPDAVTLTLSLTPAEAQQAFLAEETGSLRADVRRFGDAELVDPGYLTILDLLPLDVLERLPIGLRPEGYRPGQ